MESGGMEMRSVWDLQISISRRLLFWSGSSVITGIILVLPGNSFWRGFGIQAIAWGVIDAAIAMVGSRRAYQRRSIQNTPDQVTHEVRKLKRILWVNFGLDVIYIIGGFTLISFHSSVFWQGHGWGIILQGAFLFFFDLIHAQTVPPSVNSESFHPFQGTEHLPFFLSGGKPAALLVHGFPGTPAEMCPLGEALHRSGWTVQGILLPGFGPEIATLDERRYMEWVLAVKQALEKLKNKHTPILLIGYSMGGAVSIISASICPPDGLILIAPFWRLFSPVKSFIGIALRPFLPRYFLPFKDADLSDPKVQSAVRNFLPQIDLDDPEVQDEIRYTIVPVSVMDQLRKLGKRAYRRARQVDAPLLIVQGKLDELVKLELTIRLMARFPDKQKPEDQDRSRYLEVEAEHDLVSTSNRIWHIVEKAVLDFADFLSKPAD